MWDGDACTILGFDGPCVQLRTSTGERAAVLLAALVIDPGFAVLVDGQDEHVVTRPAGLVDQLPHGARGQAEELLEHLQEAWTGFRSGNAAAAMVGEPRPAYDPVSTTLRARVAAKARELGRGQRTLWRLRAEYARDGLWALVDRRYIRARSASRICQARDSGGDPARACRAD